MLLNTLICMYMLLRKCIKSFGFSYAEKISGLDKQLDIEAHEALEDILTKVGIAYPDTIRTYNTAEAQGMY